LQAPHLAFSPRREARRRLELEQDGHGTIMAIAKGVTELRRVKLSDAPNAHYGRGAAASRKRQITKVPRVPLTTSTARSRRGYVV